MTENAQEKEFNVEELLKMGKSAYDKIKNEKIELEPTQPLNVLIAGKTGAGKSTLINAVFGKEVAVTGSGRPVTQHVEKFTKDNFSIFDTKGLEMEAFDETISDIKDLLKDQKTKAADEQIHIAWLCIREGDRRVEDGERKLFELLKENKIPTIAVITKASQDADEKGEKLSDIVKRELGINDEIHIQRVRALEVEDDEGEIKKIMGLDKDSNKGKDGLLEKSYCLLPEGQKEAFARHQKHNDELRKKAETREHARALINRYSLAAGGVAATPIPFSDFALLLPTQIGMITHVSNAYGLDMSADTAKKLAIAFAGVAGAGFGIKLAVGSLLKIIPGLGSLAGGAMNATIAATTTKLMGHAYLSYLDDNFDELENAISSINTDIFKEYWDKAGVLFPDDAEKIASK